MTTILFAGGGTGGHVFPAIAVADEIRRQRPEAQIHFAGTKAGVEWRVVPEAGYEIHPIWISGFKRSLSAKNLLFPLKLVTSLVQSLALIRRLKPDVTVGSGGYVSGPVLYAAQKLGRPTVLQEQNAKPGVTTQLLAEKVDEVFLTFERSKNFFKRKDHLTVSGNPTRSSLGAAVDRTEARRFFGLEADRPTLLIYGGSLGALAINEAIGKCLGLLIDGGMQVVWQTGRTHETAIRAAHADRLAPADGSPARVWIGGFISRTDFALGAADLAVCRAGATTLAELTLVGLPSILVPLPTAAEDHQTENAKALVVKGAAELVKNSDAPDWLYPTIVRLMGDADSRRRMHEAALRLARPEAARTIAQAILQRADANRAPAERVAT